MGVLRQNSYKILFVIITHTFFESSVDINLEWCVFVPWETREVIYQAFSLPQGYYPFSLLKYVAYRNLHHNFSAKFAKKKKGSMNSGRFWIPSNNNAII